MYLELDGQGALYQQLARALTHAIVSRRILPGARLPSTRELAFDLGISRNTVKAAYERLCLDRLVVSQSGSATRALEVAPPRKDARPASPVVAQSRFAERLRSVPPYACRRRILDLRYDLQYGEPLVNTALATSWRAEVARAVAKFEWRYPPSAGVAELRESIAEQVMRRRGVVCSADDVVVVSGTQQALSLLARILLNEGDKVIVEDPGYELAARALLAQGAHLLPVPVDEQGLQTSSLPYDEDIRAIHVTPSHQFPTGVAMPRERRLSLLAFAARRGCWIIEDDYDGEHCYEGSAVASLHSLDRRGLVIYVGTFSKVLFPALRLGYVVCPRGLREDLIAAKTIDDIACSGIEQIALAQFMRSGAFDRHLRRATQELRRRRSALLEGLGLHCNGHMEISGSGAGMHVVGWLLRWTPGAVDALRAHGLDRGLGLHPIAPFYRKRPPMAGLLLGYASLSTKQLALATALLGRCLGEVRAHPH